MVSAVKLTQTQSMHLSEDQFLYYRDSFIFRDHNRSELSAIIMASSPSLHCAIGTRCP
jgi:hypothetical protein